MRRFCLMMVAAAGIAGWPMTGAAEDAASAAAATAAAQRYEADYKRLEDAVEEMAKAQISLREQLAEAKAEIKRLREEIERNKVNPSSFASASDAQTLAKKLNELDEKRLSDRETILKEIKDEKGRTINEVKELLRAMPTPAAHETSAPPVKPKSRVKKEKPEPAKEGPQSEYEVQPGDSLSKIVAGLNKQGIKVTQDQILEANPGLNPNKLYKGKKLIIPAAPTTNGKE